MPSPIQITAANHGYKTGQKITIVGVGGITAANGTWTVTVLDPNTFTLNGSTGSGTYTSGGVAINLDWGGCHVWISPDNSNYVQLGTMYGPSRMGVLTAQLVSSGAVDTTHTLAVDLTQSTGILNSGTQSDCDNFRTLCYVDGELISFEDATLTGSFKYDLGAHGTAQTITGATNANPIQITIANHGLSSGETVVVASVGGNTAANGTWAITVTGANTFTLNGSTGNGAYTSGGTAVVAARLQRGVFGSPIGTHNIGSVFLRLDDGVFVWEADPTLVGTTVWFKFTSFNRMGLMEQSLANATAYSFAFSGFFGNIFDLPANNATIDSIVNGSNANIRIYGPSGVGTSYSSWKRDQTNRTIAAQTLTVDNTGTGLAFNTTYWVSYDFVAGTHTAWALYKDYLQAIGRTQMRIGALTTVAAGGSGGSGGGGGSSNGNCPDWETWVRPGLQLKDAKPGMLFDCHRNGRFYQRPLRAIEFADAECFMVCAGRSAKVVSWDTWFDLPDEKSLRCYQMEGQLVLTEDGWEPCKIFHVGKRRVAKVDLGGESFAGSVIEKGCRLYSHNLILGK